MNDKTCSAGHERCPRQRAISGLNFRSWACPNVHHQSGDPHCIHGTPIGRECVGVSEGTPPVCDGNWETNGCLYHDALSHPHRVDGTALDQSLPSDAYEGVKPLEYARLAIVLEDLEGGTREDKAIAATIRAKDEEIKELREHIIEQDLMISWHTCCPMDAKRLGQLRLEEERAEAAEAALAEANAENERLKEPNDAK